MKSHYTPQISSSNALAAARHQKHKALCINMTKKWVLGIAFFSILLFAKSSYAQYVVNFEGAGETKTAYASGTVNLSGINWNMTEALIGTETGERINGIRTARLKGEGTSSMTMLGNKANGIGTISFLFRRYNTSDSQAEWKVEYSTDDGSTWTQAGASFTALPNDDIQTFSTTVNVFGPARIRIKRTTETGTSNRRLNIDDITITDYNPVPTINASPTTLSGFNYIINEGPSLNQSFSVSGQNLTQAISINAPTHYEISLSSSTGFTSALSLPHSGGSVSSTPIYVRLKAGLPQGTYSGELITLSSSGVSTVNVTLNGSVSGCENSESFSNLGTNSSSYSPRSWTGDNGETWTAQGARTDRTINGKAICWGPSGSRNLIAPVFNQGAGTLSFKYVREFTNDDNRSLEIYINNTLIQTIAVNPTSDEIKTFSQEVNRAGNVTIEIRSTGAAQVKIDDLHWTCYSDIPCDAPTTQASSAAASDVTASAANISWTKGNGSSSLVLIRKDNAVNGAPANNTSYQPNAAFGEGDEIGSGNYVAYTGDGNSFALSSLEGGTTYHIAVFTFNCSNGSELYLSTNPAVISFTTPPAQASGLKVICTDNNSATITWNPPSGQYDGVVIGMRQGTNTPLEISSLNPESINASTIFGSGTEYGTGGGNFVVYKGTENQVTVTGLTAGQSYRIRAYAYKGTTWATGQHTTSINNLGIPEVNAFTATGLSSEVLLGWSNPSAGCFDEILIVAKAGSSLTSTPSGDGSAYLSSAGFGAGTETGSGEFVVYKGVGIQSQITGLTNGTTYFAKAYVRRGNQWSSGTEISFTPANVTILDYADLAILGINTGQDGAITGTDEMIFVLFKDFLPGSSLDFTDNGYERISAGYWGTTEGVIRLTRNNTTLPAGTVIKVIGVNTTFKVYINGAEDNNWTVSSLNGSSQFNLNTQDQVWFMQGGNWSSAEGQHKGTYSGKVLYGWTATGWKPAPGYASTSGSTLYPTATCSNTNVIDKLNKEKVKYTGPVTAASKREWIARINNSTTNWTGYADNAAYNSGGSFGNSLPISPSPILGDQWIGDKSMDWFDCANWGSLRVPDENTDVVVDNTATRDLVINSGTARVRSLHINNIARNFAITGTDATTNLIITGDVHLNLDQFLHTAGTIELKGNTAQTFSGINPAFHKLVLNNPYGVYFGALNVDINGSLSLQQGMLSSSGLVHIKNNAPLALVSTALNAGIKAELRRNVTSPNTYDFPLGNATLRQNAKISLNSASGLSHITASFNANIGNTDISSQNLFIETGGVFTQLHSLLDAGYWTIEPNAGASVNYNIELALSGATNTGPDPAQHTIVKRPHSASNWNTQGTHNNNTQSLNANTITAVLSGLTAFSDFAIAKNDLGPLPVELIAFTAKLQHPNTLLFWQTASEINNHFFAIERSANAQDFETIGMVYGNGTTSFTNSYSFTDTQPLFPVSYYRLRQTDFDGSTSYSSIVMITENISNSNKLKIDQLSFNQDNSLTMTASGSLAPTVEVRVINMLGRSTFSRKFDVSQPISIPAQYLQKSISLIEVSDGQQKDVRKITLP